MHTRRVGAFLIGAWLLGSLLTAFVAAQSYTNVERFFSNPPVQVTREISDIGQEAMRQILRFQASQHNRHVFETWEVLQLGLAGALFVTSFLTSHRSRLVIICTSLMALMVLIAYFHLTPIMNALSRSYDFLPPGAAIQDRENYNYYSVWYRVLDILKTILALIVAARLLFDRYDWQEKLAPGSTPKGVRRRRRSHPASGSSFTGGTGLETAAEVRPATSNPPEAD